MYMMCIKKPFSCISKECGQAATEYALIIAVVVIMAIGAVVGTSGAISTEVYCKILDAVNGVVAQLP